MNFKLSVMADKLDENKHGLTVESRSRGCATLRNADCPRNRAVFMI